MRCKNIYPFEYIHTGSWEKFKEIKLPWKNAFYSKLKMKGISDDDQEHEQQVCNRVTLGDYHGVYVATDALLMIA